MTRNIIFVLLAIGVAVLAYKFFLSVDSGSATNVRPITNNDVTTNKSIETREVNTAAKEFADEVAANADKIIPIDTTDLPPDHDAEISSRQINIADEVIAQLDFLRSNGTKFVKAIPKLTII